MSHLKVSLIALALSLLPQFSHAMTQKICFGSGDVKGEKFLMEASAEELQISFWNLEKKVWENDLTVHKATGHIVNARDGRQYVEYSDGGAVDGAVGTVQVDKDLLLPKTKGKVRFSWKYQILSYFCRDDRQ